MPQRSAAGKYYMPQRSAAGRQRRKRHDSPKILFSPIDKRETGCYNDRKSNRCIKAVTKTEKTFPCKESRGRCDPGGGLFSDSHPFRAEDPNAARSVDVFRECCVNA